MTYIKDPAEYVGKFVLFYVNTQAGKRSKLRGVVTRVLPSGKLEILVADRGYYEVPLRPKPWPHLIRSET